MWRNWGEAYRVALRHNDRSAHTERVGCAACGGAYDKSVGLVGREAFAVDISMDSNHG